MISIIVPCYNQGRFLKDCLTSLSQSSYTHLQVIIVNDGSTEPDTIEELKNIKSNFTDLNIIVHHQKNGGLSDARNQGLQKSQGDYIQFLDCDDMVEPDKFLTQIKLFEKFPEKKCIISDYYFVSENLKTKTVPPSSIEGHRLDVLDFLTNWEKKLSIPIHCGLFKKELFDNFCFMTHLKSKEDWVFWTELSAKIGAESFLYHSDRQAVYRLNSSSMTRNPKVMMLDWIKAQTLLFVKFGHLLSEDELNKELDNNIKHLSNSYLKALTKPAGFRDATISFIKKNPLLYRFAKTCYRAIPSK